MFSGSDDSDYYHVEKLIGKRTRASKIQYRVKWTGYTSEHNSWVYEDMLNDCDEIIKEFEKKLFISIIGVVPPSDGLTDMRYAVLVKWSGNFKLMTKAEMIDMWPKELLEYLEKAIEFSPAVDDGTRSNFITHGMAVDLISTPTRVKASSNYNNSLRYMFDFDDSRFKVFPARMVRRCWTEMIINYLHNQLQAEPGDVASLRKILVPTRSVCKEISELGIALKPKVMIIRNLSLETFLLRTPFVVVRRAPPVRLRQKFSNVPIGARGRKRNEKTLLFIGVAPNPDRRSLHSPAIQVVAQVPPAIPVAPQVSPIVPAAVQVQLLQPAKRTYARLASTPFPSVASRTQLRLISTPLAPIDLPGTQAQSTVDVDFDADFGALRFSDSE